MAEMTTAERMAAREAIALTDRQWAFTVDLLRGTTVVTDLEALRRALPAALNALDAAEAENTILKRQISIARAWAHEFAVEADRLTDKIEGEGNGTDRIERQ